jgi:hypothetical protein
MPFLNQLIQFENKWGTGLKVTRQATPNTGDPNTFVAGATPVTETVVFTGIRFIETTQGSTKELLDQWGLQQGEVYDLHFRVADGIELNDIVSFNTYKEKTRTVFDSNLPVTKLRIKDLSVGDEDHHLFKAVTFN